MVDRSEVRDILTRHDVLTAFLRSDAQIRAAAEATLSGAVSTPSRLPSVRQVVRDVDGIVALRGKVA